MPETTCECGHPRVQHGSQCLDCYSKGNYCRIFTARAPVPPSSGAPACTDPVCIYLGHDLVPCVECGMTHTWHAPECSKPPHQCPSGAPALAEREWEALYRWVISDPRPLPVLVSAEVERLYYGLAAAPSPRASEPMAWQCPTCCGYPCSHTPEHFRASTTDEARDGVEPYTDSDRLDEIDWFGCMTGDCPHETQAECDVAILGVVRSVLVERDYSRMLASEARAALAATAPEDRAMADRTDVTITVHGYPPISPPTPTMTGAQIKQATQGWNPMYQLWMEGATWGRNGREDRHVFDAEVVPLVDGMKFYGVPQGCY